MGDYPDYTDLMQIIGSDIMIPMDIQAAYIMMPVDIQAQYLTLDINVKAKEVTLTIDIEAQHVGVYLQADWSALQGYDKDIIGFYSEMAQGTLYLMLDYAVPEGKTLYICHCGLSNIDNSSNVQCMIYETVDDVWKAVFGGAQGCFASFNKPLVIEAEHHLYVYGTQFSTTASDCRCHIGGYEL